ncbi:hypothetical protein ACH95_15225 [Bacillus glycinifermentans]|uniref:Secreted protein n=1 Tax=Bacillus glycinifermentans TaxID=1664069 RepID=A0A0J6EGP2_9BACI|nr:hypothetical protein [Bacillus glycinifermentans]ATH92968.1 hypothetical protein COP00_10445 [Bacillus glycinifermentans]KMM57781.1 hypothetical protein ACH95_15225 [Bacillus glycinifermentans]KRT94183.1 hypothetical protein AB447_202520 [Bacillus glycinifermentans]MEC0486333.1 hypothetical protein [Bacillus glycinifermentans]MEC0493359.1 hypothetical protein [Bacillus glycinifermentans]
MRIKAFVSLGLFCSMFAGAFIINREMPCENDPEAGAEEERTFEGDFAPMQTESGAQPFMENENAPFKPREYIRVVKR